MDDFIDSYIGRAGDEDVEFLDMIIDGENVEEGITEEVQGEDDDNDDLGNVAGASITDDENGNNEGNEYEEQGTTGLIESFELSSGHENPENGIVNNEDGVAVGGLETFTGTVTPQNEGPPKRRRSLRHVAPSSRE